MMHLNPLYRDSTPDEVNHVVAASQSLFRRKRESGEGAICVYKHTLLCHWTTLRSLAWPKKSCIGGRALCLMPSDRYRVHA
jgi:hypothetical protein